MHPQPSTNPDINQPPRRWPKRHRRLISRRRAVSASSCTQLIDLLGNTTSYQYDSIGNLTQKTNPNNTTTSYRYDANNRLIEKTTPEGTTSYQYDQNNNLITAANPFISYSMTYDTTNRLTRITDANNNSISYQYDSLGNKTATITPTGATINYSYDAANHLTTIATSTGNYSFTYDAGGRRTKLSYPSNTSTSYQYDKNNNLIDIKQTTATNSIIADTPYSYDTLNNRITKQAISYSYDPLNQLISASGTSPESYSYDALGNRQGIYQHNAANQTLSSPQGSYSYDQNGNQTSRANWTQTWNSDNQLITTTNGTTTVTFKYDPFGRRIEKTTIEPSGSTSYRYLYDGPNIIQETRTTATATETTTETTTYLHGPNIDEPLGMQRNGQNYYFHQDGLGSIIAITDASGQKVQSYSYDSFGNITAQQNTTFIQPFAYTARIWDAEIGLYDYRLRTYDPVLGKFISKDPLSFAAGDTNLYRYVGNGSPNYTDPWGLFQSPALFRALVPGQVAWDNALTSFGNGNYALGGMNLLAMVGEQVLFAASFGQSGMVKQGGQCVTKELASKPMTKLFHGGSLRGGSVQASKFSTTTDISHAMKYAEQYSGSIYEFNIPTRSLYELERQGLVQRGRDTLIGTLGDAPEWRFFGEGAFQLNRYMK